MLLEFRIALAALLLICVAMRGDAAPMDSSLASKLLPEPRELVSTRGSLRLSGRTFRVGLPAGPENAACRSVVRAALALAGAHVAGERAVSGCAFCIGAGAPAPTLPTQGVAAEGYTLSVAPGGVSSRAASPAGLLYAAETLLQLVRASLPGGRLHALAIRDSPEFKMRGIYVEGGQERYGRIVSADYLKAQIRRLAMLKMNTMVVEAYNLFPYASFPACADAGTLTRAEAESVFAEARKWHVVMVPSLQTLAQSWELVWANEAGAPYREVTSPGMMCPSNPDIYPFIKGLYRDLLTWFSDSPLIGIGCSEIEMQWQSRYCPRCKERIDHGETVRGLLLGHAEKCARAVEELSVEMHHPVRPMMWADEFYMYGPGRDWVGIERMPHSVVMGFWKYWQDYKGIEGLMSHGYDVFGISAIYNHCFYLVDLSPEDPKKSWPPMEQTGLRNIAEMAQEAAAARRAHPDRQLLGIATASFSKHRLRAFDSLWAGFALNAQCLWSRTGRPLSGFKGRFLHSYVRYMHGARSDAATEALAGVYEKLDACKSRLELANQSLHDVVGVYDTQEAGYQGNTLRGAWQRCGELLTKAGKPTAALSATLLAARRTEADATDAITALDAQASHVDDADELANLRMAAVKIRNHAARQALLIESRSALARAPAMPPAEAKELLEGLAKRWTEQKREVEAILRRVAPLYSQGDPTGYSSVLGDVIGIQEHFARLATRGPKSGQAADGETLIDEKFVSLDPSVWLILGSPRIDKGQMATSAPGGFSRYCGLLTRRTFDLDARRPLIVELDLTADKIGQDSQLIASATQPNGISFRFAMAGSGGRLAVHTQCSKKLGDGWADPSAGWHQRKVSPELAPGRRYKLRAEITRGTWRVIMHGPGETPWDLPFWDTGAVPMDDLASTRLVFADVEPEGGSGASRWGPIRIGR
jgi:hypothetical protein